ncbi:probable serine/threonine-protein kinase PBL26 [Gossypium hirsutum]|uniref:non-specific serine/threonine protein kinase n=1 Tax=Gossypium hirsutum TaxID=3635 RepID=A0A1U8KCB5_GOSHI|nr:probable serine/threonine-protein kinase PBL26 [Gossypium hirsutum]
MNSVHQVVLGWPTRLQIVVAAAQGLCYMQDECLTPIIHHDVKSRNILLYSEFNAKSSNFGLAMMLTRHASSRTMSAVEEFHQRIGLQVSKDQIAAGISVASLLSETSNVFKDLHEIISDCSSLENSLPSRSGVVRRERYAMMNIYLIAGHQPIKQNKLQLLKVHDKQQKQGNSINENIDRNSKHIQL